MHGQNVPGCINCIQFMSCAWHVLEPMLDLSCILLDAEQHCLAPEYFRLLRF